MPPLTPPIQLICTDFDGTLHSDYTVPPVPVALQDALAEQQAAGARWMINTGRELDDLLEGLRRVQLSVQPDYLVVVEREIHQRVGDDYEPFTEWNEQCAAAQAAVFETIADLLPPLFEQLRLDHDAHLYEDPWSPFCFIARDNAEADAIQAVVDALLADLPNIALVRNDIYGRLSHTAYTKGSAMAEVARQLSIAPQSILAAGDHWNDLSMLRADLAHWLVAPANAMPEVTAQVRAEGGYIATTECGEGVLEGLQHALNQLAKN